MSHSSIVGGSNADRLLACPGSYQAILALPALVDKPSEYALEGTAMHDVMANLMRLRREAPDANLYVAASDLIGTVFGDRELTLEHVDTMIHPALDTLMALEAAYLDGFDIVAVERSVNFPGIPGARGTVDLILASKSHILHVDWKFGQGLPVKAVYADPAGDIVNAQLLFYVAAAMHSVPAIYKGKKQLVAAIIQPRADAPLSHTLVTRKEIKWFTEDLRNAVTAALDRDPPLHKGEHCRWCPAKIACPLWTAPMLQLANISEQKRTEMVSSEITEYGAYLARAKELVDMAAQFKTELDKQLHAYLEDGGKVPGWRLKAKVKQRKWIDDEDRVEAELMDLGFEMEDCWQAPKLQTFTKADAIAKKLGVEIPGELRMVPESNETTVCRDDDPAPAVSKPLAIEQFRAALAALKTA